MGNSEYKSITLQSIFNIQLLQFLVKIIPYYYEAVFVMPFNKDFHINEKNERCGSLL